MCWGTRRGPDMQPESAKLAFIKLRQKQQFLASLCACAYASVFMCVVEYVHVRKLTLIKLRNNSFLPVCAHVRARACAYACVHASDGPSEAWGIERVGWVEGKLQENSDNQAHRFDLASQPFLRLTLCL